MESVNMNPKYLKGDYLINLDWEESGSLCNSCAGGDLFCYERRTDWEALPEDFVTVSISFGSLLGGHSGSGINRGHANALVSLATAMERVKQHDPVFGTELLAQSFQMRLNTFN